MRIVYPESRRFRISFVVERVCRSANTGCPVPLRGPDFLCRIRSCGLPRVRAAAFSRTGPRRGRARVVSGICLPGRVPCPYNLQACADMPDQSARPAGRRAPGPLLFLRLTPSLFFSAGIAAGSGAAFILFWNCRSAAGASGLLRAASSGVPYAGEVGFSPARLRGYGLVWPGC